MRTARSSRLGMKMPVALASAHSTKIQLTRRTPISYSWRLHERATHAARVCRARPRGRTRAREGSGGGRADDEGPGGDVLSPFLRDLAAPRVPARHQDR